MHCHNEFSNINTCVPSAPFAALNSVVNRVTRPNLVIVSDDHMTTQSLTSQNKRTGSNPCKAGHNLCAVAGRKKDEHTSTCCIYLKNGTNKRVFYYLMDDDLVYPSFYRNIWCTTHRILPTQSVMNWRANSNGHLVGYNPIHKSLKI